MAEVEIISMLIPLSASTWNMVAATPGLDFMPAPITLTFAIARSVTTAAAPTSAARSSHTAIASSIWA